MKLGPTWYLFAFASGWSIATAADDPLRCDKHITDVVPTEINGLPYRAVSDNRSTQVFVYNNSTGPLFSTTASPRRNLMDDMQFVPAPADYAQPGDPILGATGPFPTGNILTDQFAVGFTYDGGDSLGKPIPDLDIIVSFYDQDMLATFDNPVDNPAKFIGSFHATFRGMPAQTGLTTFTSSLFRILDASNKPVRFLFPQSKVAFSLTFLKESQPGSGKFDIPATAYTACFASGTATTNSEGHVGPVVGGSAAIFMRDTDSNGHFTQSPGINEYRTFAQPNNANFWFQVTGACNADFDGDGMGTGDDFDAYVTAFMAGDSAADFDGDGFVAGEDFDAFLLAFQNGC